VDAWGGVGALDREAVRAVIEATRRSSARADERNGRRGPWLRGLDRIGARFDSKAADPAQTANGAV